MIRQVIQLLQMDDWLNSGECTEIAKGKYQLPTTLKGATKKIKRLWQSKR
jgi:hypothetical protein